MRKVSLKSRILVGFSLTFCFSIMASIFFVYSTFQSMLTDTVRIGSINLTASLVDSIKKQLTLTNDVDSLARFSLDISRIVESASMVEYIRILSDDLIVVASPNRAEEQEKLTGTDRLLEQIGSTRVDARIIETEDAAHVVVPVNLDEPPMHAYMLVTYTHDYLNAARGKMINQSLIVAFLILFIASIVTFFLFHRYIEGPLAELADTFLKAKNGNLDINVPDFETEEFSEAGRSMDEMMIMLRAAASTMNRQSVSADDASRKINEALQRLKALRAEHHRLLKEAHESATQQDAALRTTETSVSKLHGYSEETSSFVLEILSSLEEVDEQMVALTKIIEDTLLKTSEMSEGFSEVTTNTQELAQESDDLASAISEIIQSIKMVEQHAATNRDLSQRVTTHAREGVAAIARTETGMSSIKESVSDMNDVIGTLGSRAEEIEGILRTINQIAEKTNLLALNAAIIAAQAGEHGRSFTVVADEIRELAAQTAASTSDIEGKVSSVQVETQNVITKMRESLTHVASGESMLNETVVTLNSIMASSQESDEMSQTIATATVEQVKVSRQIGEVTNRIQSYLHQIAQAMKSQEVSANQLTKGSEQVRDLSQSVLRATMEQRDGVTRLNEQIESMFSLSNTLRDSATEQGSLTQRIDENLAGLAATLANTAKNEDSLEALVDQLQAAAAQATAWATANDNQAGEKKRGATRGFANAKPVTT